MVKFKRYAIRRTLDNGVNLFLTKEGTTRYMCSAEEYGCEIQLYKERRTAEKMLNDSICNNAEVVEVEIRIEVV